MMTRRSCARPFLAAALCLAGATFAPQALAEEPPQAAAARARFAALDSDSDGLLTADELGRPRLFARLDEDGDGVISVDEALALLPPMPETRNDQDRATPESATDARGEREPESAPAQVAMQTTRDLVYATREGHAPSLTSLDVYAPMSGRDHPVMVMIHGGGWRIGDKSNPGIATEKPGHFVGQGYVYVAINYRLSPAITHPAHIEDVAAAIAWVHDHIAAHGGDPARIAIMGHSAGAQLAALVAVDRRWLTAQGKSLGIIESVILLDGAGYDIAGHFGEIPAGGVLHSMYRDAFGDEPAVWADASPTLHVAKGQDTPRFQIFYVAARIDSAFQSRGLARALTDAGVAVELVPAADKTHMTLNRDIGRADDWVSDRIDAFLRPASEMPTEGEKTR